LSDKLFDNRAPSASNDNGNRAADNANDDNSSELDYIALLKEQGRPVDQAALAKSKYHADMTIEQLKAELNGLRSDLDNRLSYEDLMDQIKKMTPTSKTVLPDESEQGLDNNEGINNKTSPDDLQRLIRDTLKQESARAQAENNILQAKKALEQAWGRSYQSALLAKTEELGVSKEFLEQMAAQSPKLLLKTLGVENARPGMFNEDTPPRTSVEPRVGNQNSNTKNYKHFENIRKTDPRAYWSPQVQREMHKQAAAQGESFYR
jgi:hypothetical protein